MRNLKRAALATSAFALLACGGGSKGAGGGVPPPPPGVTTVNFSTYLGSNQSDWVRDVAVDSAGNVYAVGGTLSSDLPTTAGTFQPSFGGYEDAFAVKFNPQGQILWSTYLGGTELDRAYAVELDHQGNVILAGRAGASFPVTPGALQTQFRGGGTSGNVYPHPQDGFVAKLNASNGARIWATFFGATDNHANVIRDIAVDKVRGDIYLAASTDTGSYPAAVLAAFQFGHRSARFGLSDGVLAKLSNDGASLAWATYVGGTDFEGEQPSVVIDSQGNPVVLFPLLSADAETTALAFDRSAGVGGGNSDFYVAKFALSGPLIWATYLGGSDSESAETHNLAIRPDDALVVAASSASLDYPTTPGAFDSSFAGKGSIGTGQGTNYNWDCSITVLAPDARSLIGSTYYGGTVGEGCEGVGVDASNNVYVTGAVFSPELPTTSGAYQATKPPSGSPFIAVFNRDLTRLRYGSFFGGNGESYGRALTVHGVAHFVFGGQMGAGYPLVNAARSNVSAGFFHGAVTDISVPLGPG